MNKRLLNKFLEGDTAIQLRTQQGWDALMEYLEKETDLLWLSGCKPTGFNGWIFEKNNTAVCVGINRIVQGNIDSFKKTIIEFEELFQEETILNNIPFEEIMKTLEWVQKFTKELETGKIDISSIVNETKRDKFTEDEEAILRNVTKYYKWLARDEDGDLCIYEDKPKKEGSFWNYGTYLRLEAFEHLFRSIKWEDDEPCEFRKYL